MLRPQARFLLRVSALLIGLLVLWWFVLLSPLLFLLRQSAELCASVAFGGSARFIDVTATGDWTVHVPIETVIPMSPGQPAPVAVHSIDFDLARADAGAFTFGLPVLWAILVAAPEIRRGRPLALGTAAMMAVELVLFLVYVELFAHKTAAQWAQSQDAVSNWFYRFADYLLVSVIPYVAPFAVAIGVSGELRGQIFGWAAGQPAARRPRKK